MVKKCGVFKCNNKIDFSVLCLSCVTKDNIVCNIKNQCNYCKQKSYCTFKCIVCPECGEEFHKSPIMNKFECPNCKKELNDGI
ncbi:MAG: hypothetical protein K0Q47_135 [Sedimentibacter sp.]|jgi:hypothetical protein|nr:hypothetical protein [Sedimentibacter sp.]